MKGKPEVLNVDHKTWKQICHATLYNSHYILESVMPKLHLPLLLGFIALFGIITFPPNAFGAYVLEERCLGDENARKLDFRLTVGIQEFDEIFKEAVVSFDIDAEDDETNEPFEIHMKRYPNTGGRTINVGQDEEHGNYEVTEKTFTNHRVIPKSVSEINMWPFEEYTIPIFLEFNENVQLCYYDSDETDGDIHIYKAGYFPENPNWKVDLTYFVSSPAEIEETIPGAKSYFNSSVFRFDSVISHPEGYQTKQLFYAAIVLAPIILIIGHALFVRTEKLNSHVTFFTGISILILTGIVMLSAITPRDLTWLEVVSIGSIATYAVGFFVFLGKRHHTIQNENTRKEIVKKQKEEEKTKWEQDSDKRRIQALPKKLDE